MDLIYDPESPTQDFIRIFLNTDRGHTCSMNEEEWSWIFNVRYDPQLL
ncbi:hypothetical protein LEP1GSC060_0645 [Leptospira weilii serovar Ranarum str. ICFT]|uniref:Uncharacterized protein n=1 Tax=Leptospira weilii serovar Ranarum str. ICFT TaxID=1218598 RepID=N1WDI5_9LEPT|nr:hypothetical protein LEP1GSC060_0645 [Leptospira weilii serovar Ranarum str. ICFT]